MANNGHCAVNLVAEGAIKLGRKNVRKTKPKKFFKG